MKPRNVARERGRHGRTKWLSIAVIAVLVVAFSLNPATPTPARADCIGVICPGGGPGTVPPAILLNPDQITGNGQFAGNIYNATPAQVKSLDNLQAQAIQNMLSEHGLPSSDYTAAETWGRDDALADLWGLILQAMQLPASCSSGQMPGKDCRNADQQNAVDWLTTAYKSDAIQAAKDSGLEYVKWAGLNQSTYNADVTKYENDLGTNQDTSTDTSNLQNFLFQGFSPGAVNYTDAVNTCPSTGLCTTYGGKNYTEGFCVYHPPSPFQSDYSDQNNILCTTPCPFGTNCIPLGPTYDQLVKYGAADVNNQLFDNPSFAQESNNVAIGVGIGIGTAAAITTLSLVGAAIPVGVTLTVGGVAIASAGVFPFAAAIGAVGVIAASFAALALIAVAGAIAIGFYSVALFNARDVPGQLVNLLTSAESTTPDLRANLGDSSELQGLYSLFIGASLPSAVSPPCNGSTGSTCLTEPAIPGVSTQTDPLFEDQINTGTASAPILGPTVQSNTISWTNKQANLTTGAQDTLHSTGRLSGNWFVDTVNDTTAGTTSTVQTLRIHYSDWNGNGQTAELYNFPSVGYQFVGVADQSPSGTAVNASTCLSNTTCSHSSTIDYVGTDGKDHRASVFSPLPAVGQPRLGNCPSQGCPVPSEGSPTSLTASASSPLGKSLSYTWTILDKPLNPPIQICFNGQLQVVPCPPPTVTKTGTVATGGSTLSYSFPTSGSFAVTVTATDSDGRSASSTGTFDVQDVAPQLSIYPACDPLLICLHSNLFTWPPGSLATLGGDVIHAGSEDVESLDINWGDNSAHDTVSNQGSCAQFQIGCDLHLSFFSANQSTGSDGIHLSFAGTHTYTNPGKYSVTLTVTDQSGAKKITTETETVLYPTQTSLSSQTNPSVYGQSVTFTAGVSSSGTGTPGGTVEFIDGTGDITGCSARPVDTTTETAICTTSALSVATHGVTAVYSGDSTFNTSPSSTLSQTVSQAGTNTHLTTSLSPSVWGQPVTFTAAVSVKSPGAGNPSGTVEFKDGAADINGCGSQPVDTTTEEATCTTSALSVAGHSVTAWYSGDTNFVSSSATALTQTVNKDGTSSGLNLVNSIITAGHAASFNATVSANSPGAGTPSGTVTFKDGSTTLGTGSLTSPPASFNTSSLSVGAHSITAAYGGDGNFLTSTSSAIIQYVDTNLSGYPKLPSGAYNLSNANLKGGYFVGMSLLGASLTGSNLTGAVFLGANLTGASLSNSNLKAANFTNANMTNANLSNSNSKAANFTGANLTGANFAGSNLKGATGLKTATITGVIWSKTTCPDATLSNNDGGTCAGHL